MTDFTPFEQLLAGHAGLLQDSVHDRWVRAQSLFEEKAYREAIVLLKELIAEPEDFGHGLTEARLLLARSYYHSALLGPAIDAAREVLASDPHEAVRPPAPRALAAASEQAGRGREAPEAGRISWVAMRPDVSWHLASTAAADALESHARSLLGPGVVTSGRLCPACGSDAHGRPWIRHEGRSLHVSLSRSGPHLATAIATPGSPGPVGIDVEVARIAVRPELVLAPGEDGDLAADLGAQGGDPQGARHRSDDADGRCRAGRGDVVGPAGSGGVRRGAGALTSE